MRLPTLTGLSAPPGRATGADEPPLAKYPPKSNSYRIWHEPCYAEDVARQGGRRRRSRLARPCLARWVIFLLGAMPSLWSIPGCVMPAPLFEEDTANSPLVVDETQVRPALGEVRSLIPCSSVQSFQLGAILDEDLDDTIRIRWFLDWMPGIQQLESLPPTGSVLRTASPWAVDFCNPVYTSQLQGSRVVVEAVITDRDFLTDASFRLVPPEASVRTVSWVLDGAGDCGSPQ